MCASAQRAVLSIAKLSRKEKLTIANKIKIVSGSRNNLSQSRPLPFSLSLSLSLSFSSLVDFIPPAISALGSPLPVFFFPAFSESPSSAAMFSCCRRGSLDLDDIAPPLRASLENIPLPHHDMYRFKQIERILLRLQNEACDIDALEDAMDQIGVWWFCCFLFLDFFFAFFCIFFLWRFFFSP
jgi:hypothetical protein